MLRKIALWIDDRLHVSKLFESTAGHTVPASAGSWFYVFGSGTLLCFVIQIVTGICLAFVYVPSANEAYITLEYLNFYQPLGWYLRALHFWGSNFMVSIMAIHMVQVFLFGAFKYPRELTWISGCVLLLLTLGMAFTGQIMHFNQDAYWGLGIGAAIMGRVPVIGPNLVHLLLGGPIIAGETLSRFFTLHVFVIPGLLIALISLHLRLVLAKGINEYPVPGARSKRETYAEEYESLLKEEGVPFYPKAIDKDLIFSGLVILGILGCAAYFGRKKPGIAQPDLYRHRAGPGFLFPLDLCRAGIAAAVHGDFSSAHRAGGWDWASLCASFYFQHRGKKYRRRPMAVLGVILIALILGTLTHLGTYAPWSPRMEAWSLILRRCSMCTDVRRWSCKARWCCRTSNAGIATASGAKAACAARHLMVWPRVFTQDQLIRQVLQGGGNMPALGRNLAPQEVTALVAFMQTLRPANVPAARDPAVPATPGG